MFYVDGGRHDFRNLGILIRIDAIW